MSWYQWTHPGVLYLSQKTTADSCKGSDCDFTRWSIQWKFLGVISKQGTDKWPGLLCGAFGLWKMVEREMNVTICHSFDKNVLCVPFYCVFWEFGCFLSLNPAWHHSHTGKKWEWWEQTDSDRLNLCVPDWITSHCSSPSAWTAEDSLDPLQQHSVVAAQGVTGIKPTSNLDILFQIWFGWNNKSVAATPQWPWRVCFYTVWNSLRCDCIFMDYFDVVDQWLNMHLQLL